MKVFGLVVFVAGLIAFTPSARTAQGTSRGTELKEVSTTLPSGEPITMTALTIDRNWETSTTHLQGNVQVLIRESVKAGDRFLVVRADEATLNEKSGQLMPAGNVRVSQEVR